MIAILMRNRTDICTNIKNGGTEMELASPNDFGLKMAPLSSS
jgi:hypothetical protein